jgi:hypothetical protein
MITTLVVAIADRAYSDPSDPARSTTLARPWRAYRSARSSSAMPIWSRTGWPRSAQVSRTRCLLRNRAGSGWRPHKNWATLQDMLIALLEIRAERSTTLIALGGGSSRFLTGFCRATYQTRLALRGRFRRHCSRKWIRPWEQDRHQPCVGKNMIGASTTARGTYRHRLPQHASRPRLSRAWQRYQVRRDSRPRVPFLVEANMDALLARDAAALGTAIHESCRIKATSWWRMSASRRARAAEFRTSFGHPSRPRRGTERGCMAIAVGAGMVLAAKLSLRVTGLPRRTARDSKRCWVAPDCRWRRRRCRSPAGGTHCSRQEGRRRHGAVHLLATLVVRS